MDLLLIVAIGLFLAYANGANDNFKGVATLYGSGTTSYSRALIWGTATTALGSLCALLLARGLLASFSGKGLVPPAVVADPSFAMSVGFAAAGTVFLATRFGFPISTTHALLGGLIGAGLVASPAGVSFDRLQGAFLIPLLVSPVIAAFLALVAYPPLRFLRRRWGIEPETCICIEGETVAVVPGARSIAQALAMTSIDMPSVHVELATCRVRYRGTIFGFSARIGLDAAHFLSAGAASFARGLNDTPKIAALLLAGQAVAPGLSLLAVGGAMALGGLISARRVAHTMSHGITDMNPGQGFVANAVTSGLVIIASRLGVPVSTTHVSCGSLFGIGTITRQAKWKNLGQILLAWIITLPLAAGLGTLAFLALRIFWSSGAAGGTAG